eukprot:CAMPEP_0167743480 /NCGR_PEP_ID=MMETSP0110_2-20121227/2038_1 /TAXON_ID=629695 /ORGANISM="Gymnochlora sp., Strain CCMP2014" /LENGTH=581 /DNA_ID=CAMNT_0007627853 /DNA_START=617 /DNA_END=2366 /DNA_ORIENTATION=+
MAFSSNRVDLSDKEEQPRHFYWSWLVRISLVVAAVIITQYLAPEGVGSGIPQLKAVLAGEVELEAFLSERVFAGKILATICALGAGLPIGREGPFIHLAAAVAAILRMRVFKGEISKRRLLCAGAAVGIAACMGSAVGGTLFSIEVTSITFIVSYYWSTFSAAIIALVINAGLQKLLTMIGIVPLFSVAFTDVNAEGFLIHDFIIMSFIGLCCGFLGPLYVHTHAKFVQFRRFLKHKYYPNLPIFLTSQITTAIILTTTYCLFCFLMGGALTVPQRLLLNDLLTPGELPKIWAEGFREEIQLPLLAATVFLFSIAFCTIRIPAGIFASMFVCGASIGRFVGLITGRFHLELLPGTSPGERLACFALVGGAGMTSSVTQTFSAGIIAYGLTGLDGLLMPVLLVTLISCGIAMQLSHNIYDSSCILRHIPLLLVPSNHHALEITAESLMTPVDGLMIDNAVGLKVGQGKKLLNDIDPHAPIPVVHSAGNPLLLGSMSHRMLKLVLDACERVGRQEISTQEEAVIPLVDQCPLIVNKDANLQKIAFLFHTLRAESAFVVDFGIAIGTITRGQLIDYQNENFYLY